jgi:hypothetical protein
MRVLDLTPGSGNSSSNLCGRVCSPSSISEGKDCGVGCRIVEQGMKIRR